MNRKPMAALSMGLGAVGMTTASVLPSGAQVQPLPIAVELLTPRSTFTVVARAGARQLRT